MADVAAADCFLLLWMPLTSIFRVTTLMTAWGFTYSGPAFVWVKRNKNGTWFKGTGYGTRANAEICWLGRRVKPQRRSKSVGQIIETVRRQHSRKPDEIYSLVETFCDGAYLELFARQQWPGWVCVGDEVGKFAP